MTDWHNQAACRDAEPETFFPYSRDGYEHAVSYCAGCPVRTACLTWALDKDQRYGVWGGMTEAQRESIKRREQRRARR